MDKQKILSDMYDELANNGNWRTENYELILKVGGLKVVGKEGEVELKIV